EHDLGLFLGGKPSRFLPPICAPLSSRSARSLRGDLDGYLLWLHWDTSCPLLYPKRCPMKLYTKPVFKVPRPSLPLGFGYQRYTSGDSHIAKYRCIGHSSGLDRNTFCG